MNEQPQDKQPTPREKFEAGLRKLISVPKTEIVRREKEYKTARKRQRKLKRQ
jgi:hypothetical protein